MNRTTLQQLSNARVEDAEALLAASRWSGAYYLAGYALECALKSCVLAYIERTGIIFEDRRFAERCWTHDIEALVVQSGLAAALGAAIAANAQFSANWLTVKGWSEAARYRLSTQQEAEELFAAVTDKSDGVMTWARNHW